VYSDGFVSFPSAANDGAVATVYAEKYIRDRGAK